MNKCYKHNENSCCNIINDEYIQAYVESYIPEACIRKFPELEDLLCFGCSAREQLYMDEEKRIRICKSFAKKVWNVTNDEGLKKPSTRFDGCGLLVGESEEDGNNFWEKLSEDDIAREIQYIIPSKVFGNFLEFINTLKIPYYPESEIIIDESDDESKCFNEATLYKRKNLLSILLSIIVYLL